MKTVCIIIFFLQSFHLVAQDNVAIVQQDALINAIKEKVYLDTMYAAIYQAFHKKGMESVKRLQKKYIKYQRYLENAPPIRSDDPFVDAIKAEQERLISFETYMTDTLLLFKQAVIDEIAQLIKTEVVQYAKNKQLQYVFDAKDLKYYDHSLDITYELLERIKAKQSLNPIWIDQVETLKVTYKIAEKLNAELVEE